MTAVLLLSLVVGFTAAAPRIYQQRGTAALWALAACGSLLAALVFAFLDEPGREGIDPLGRLFFWPALIAAGTGFSLLVLLIRRRQSGPIVRTSGLDLVLGLVVWIVGATIGGLVAAGAGLLWLSRMAP